MKNIDTKSFLIGGLLASTIILAAGADISNSDVVYQPTVNRAKLGSASAVSLCSHGGSLYLADLNGILKSSNGGATWVEFIRAKGAR